METSRHNAVGKPARVAVFALSGFYLLGALTLAPGAAFAADQYTKCLMINSMKRTMTSEFSNSSRSRMLDCSKYKRTKKSKKVRKKRNTVKPKTAVRRRSTKPRPAARTPGKKAPSGTFQRPPEGFLKPPSIGITDYDRGKEFDPARLARTGKDFAEKPLQDHVSPFDFPALLEGVDREALAEAMEQENVEAIKTVMKAAASLADSVEEKERIASALQMLTSVATGAAVAAGALTPVGAIVIGATVVFSSSGVVQYQKDIEAGFSEKEATARAVVYGGGSAVFNTVVDYGTAKAFSGCKALYGLAKGSKAVAGEGAEAACKAISGATQEMTKKRTAQEGAELGAQTFASSLFSIPSLPDPADNAAANDEWLARTSSGRGGGILGITPGAYIRFGAKR